MEVTSNVPSLGCFPLPNPRRVPTQPLGGQTTMLEPISATSPGSVSCFAERGFTVRTGHKRTLQDAIPTREIDDHCGVPRALSVDTYISDSRARSSAVTVE